MMKIQHKLKDVGKFRTEAEAKAYAHYLNQQEYPTMIVKSRVKGTNTLGNIKYRDVWEVSIGHRGQNAIE
jgi:hypothetical protein